MEPEFFSEIDAHKLTMLWTIKNASAIFIDEKHSGTYVSGYFESKSICTMTGMKLRWEMRFKQPSKSSKFCSMEIKLDPTFNDSQTESFNDDDYDYEYDVRSKVALLNYKNSDVLYSKGPSVVSVNKKSPIFVYEEYVLKSNLESFFVDEILQIECELFYSNGSFKGPTCEISAQSPSKIPIQNQLSSDLSSLLSSEDFSDLIIQTSTGDIKAHKTILAARSPVFNSILKSSPMVENMESRIEIQDFSCEIVREMLNFIYTSTLTVGDKNIETLSELFKISHKYQLNELMKKCSELIALKLDLENIVGILKISNLYDHNENVTFRAKALSIIETNMKNLVVNEEFKDLKNSHPQLIAHIFFDMNGDLESEIN